MRRWLADGMLGRLARYLRFLGEDVEYVSDVDDREIIRRAEQEGRILLTRDRQLAARTAGALWIQSPWIREQLQGVRATFPDLSRQVRFDRCSVCNGVLQRERGSPQTNDDSKGRARRAPGNGRAIYACSECGHRYWEGTHTREIRRHMEEWLGAAGP